MHNNRRKSKRNTVISHYIFLLLQVEEEEEEEEEEVEEEEEAEGGVDGSTGKGKRGAVIILCRLDTTGGGVSEGSGNGIVQEVKSNCLASSSSTWVYL